MLRPGNPEVCAPGAALGVPGEEGGEHDGASLPSTLRLGPSVAAHQAAARTRHALKTAAPRLSLPTHPQSEPESPVSEHRTRASIAAPGEPCASARRAGPLHQGGPRTPGAPQPLQPHPLPHLAHVPPSDSPLPADTHSKGPSCSFVLRDSGHTRVWLQKCIGMSTFFPTLALPSVQLLGQK